MTNTRAQKSKTSYIKQAFGLSVVLFLGTAIWDKAINGEQKQEFCALKGRSIRAELQKAWEATQMENAFASTGVSTVRTEVSYSYKIREEDGVHRIFDRVCSGEIVVRWPPEPKIEFPQNSHTPGF